MDRLWEQRRLYNAPPNLEGLQELQQAVLLVLVTAVRAQTAALQDTAALQQNNALLRDI
ncbi:unnamed protein product [Staurois parvus]|uniref:Uncharacterized protein n=1 Tax=Staurois parvus TaxID=386267 RepID=A0ABN9DQY6_9NEOB|nr:unnamed protein product [Staurois parvus]